jgi:cytochrome c553
MKSAALLLSCLLLGAFAAPALAAESSAAAASAPAAAATPKASKPDLAKGQAIATSVCVACHAVDGSRGQPAYPILEGQHAAYLVKQLVEFKSSKRENAIMTGMASALSEQDMKDVAAFYASKKAPVGYARNKDLVAVAEPIFRGGAANRNIPACAGCHSPNGAGIPVQYPRLGGQHADYIDAQLVAFRSGARTNSAAMTGIAQYLTDHEIKALADYIAGLR